MQYMFRKCEKYLKLSTNLNGLLKKVSEKFKKEILEHSKGLVLPFLLSTGLINPESERTYVETNRNVEKWCQLVYFAAVKGSSAGVPLLMFVIGYYRYFTTDIGNDAFELLFQTWYVRLFDDLNKNLHFENYSPWYHRSHRRATIQKLQKYRISYKDTLRVVFWRCPINTGEFSAKN